LPVFGNLRTWIRFALMVALGLSILGGAGLFLALRGVDSRRVRQWGAVAFIALAMIEVWPGPLGTMPVEPRPVDVWLAAQTDDAPIMEYPLSVAVSGPSMYYTLHHNKPITYGFGMFFEMIYLEENPELERFPDDDALDTLEGWGVRYVLVTVPAVSGSPFTLDDIALQPRLHYVTTQGDVAVYELRPVESS
jgi:hypothetical protein